MHKSSQAVGFWSAVAMGIGTMVGAGIFALLGQAGAIAGSAVWLSFVAGGFIALLSGYSLGRLGARYPSAGGPVEYLVRGFGKGVFSGAMSVMMYISSLISVALIARTFGSYAYALLPTGQPAIMVDIFAAAIVLALMFVNLGGARAMARAENMVVAVKMAVLAVFALAGLAYMDPTRLSPHLYPSVSTILFSLAVTFFAYEGFRVITNAAEDMPDPARTLPRAIMAAIAIVMALYVAIAFAVFGNLPVDQAIAAKDFALAEAARPIFGETGFVIVSFTALLATSSAINASLYAATNVTYQLARYGEIPAAFGRPIGHSREGLLISSAIIIALALAFDLSQIAAIGAVSTLFIHMTIHIGHLRLRRETGARLWLIVLAILANLTAIILSGFYLSSRSPTIIIWIASFLAGSLLLEILLRWFTARTVKKRCPDHI
jgi:amino acid transporter